MKTLITLITSLMLTFPAIAQKITKGQFIPEFETVDVYGTAFGKRTIEGRKTLISFMRNAGCPICNLHVHEMLQRQAEFDAAGIDIVLIYESSSENLLKYLDEGKLPFTFIADPGNRLYKLFSVERSFGKLMKANFHGAMGKMRKGKKLFTSKIKQDGKLTTVGADFLIDEYGKVITAHYGKYVGDHLSADNIIKLVRN